MKSIEQQQEANDREHDKCEEDKDRSQELYPNDNQLEYSDSYNRSCSGRFSTGRWDKNEHRKFIEALKKYGKDWGKVQQYVGTRSSTQARSHAQKFFPETRERTYRKPRFH